MNLSKIKTIKIHNLLVDAYPYFISQSMDKTNSHSRIRPRDFSIIQIIKILECLTTGEKSFCHFFKCSNFGLKRSFINYVNLCIDFNFIGKEKTGDKRNSPTEYYLKEKGKIFLDLFKNASC